MKTNDNKNSSAELTKPLIINGDLAVDDRGELMFANQFDMSLVKRFYVVTNHKQGFIRAWHAHKKESKYVFVVSGTALISTVRIDDWRNPSSDLSFDKFILSSKKPAILHIPNGYANGFKTLSTHTNIMFFSTSTLKESMDDDYRFDAYKWNPWEVVER
jgi:dTDP-4-dehydrorhamnose 3,5-epimerase-like enzyme